MATARDIMKVQDRLAKLVRRDLLRATQALEAASSCESSEFEDLMADAIDEMESILELLKGLKP